MSFPYLPRDPIGGMTIPSLRNPGCEAHQSMLDELGPGRSHSGGAKLVIGKPGVFWNRQGGGSATADSTFGSKTRLWVGMFASREFS